MTIQPVSFVRKPFRVSGVQVTPDNMAEVAEWCGGKHIIDTDTTSKSHVYVNVKRPNSARQTMAYVGDWVLLGETGGFKVYLPGPFERSFNPAVTIEVGDVDQLVLETQLCDEPSCTADMSTEACPNAKTLCLAHCGEDHDGPSEV